MGLTNSSRNSKIVSIINGKFTIRLDDDSNNPSAVERTLTKGNNAGKVVKELQYTGIEGKIQSAYVSETEYGSTFNTILIDDENDSFTLQISLESSYFGQYAKRMPNINKDEAIFFGLGYDRERERHFLYAKQNGEKVPMKFTRDNPNDMPPPVKKTIKGVEKWDWEEQENFLYEVAMDFSSASDVEGSTEEIPF